MSLYKIIFSIVLVSGLLIAALFMTHLKKPTSSQVFANEHFTVFQAPRELKEFSLMRTDNKAFNQGDLIGHWSLLFFGFTHCQSICPVTLELLNQTYQQLKSQYQNLQVVFISLDPTRDNPERLANYTASFNKAFIAVSGKIAQIRKLQSQFGIYSARKETDSDYQIIHTPNIMLINPKGNWVATLNTSANEDDFKTVFNIASTDKIS